MSINIWLYSFERRFLTQHFPKCQWNLNFDHFFEELLGERLFIYESRFLCLSHVGFPVFISGDWQQRLSQLSPLGMTVVDSPSLLSLGAILEPFYSRHASYRCLDSAFFRAKIKKKTKQAEAKNGEIKSRKWTVFFLFFLNCQCLFNITSDNDKNVKSDPLHCWCTRTLNKTIRVLSHCSLERKQWRLQNWIILCTHKNPNNYR